MSGRRGASVDVVVPTVRLHCAETLDTREYTAAEEMARARVVMEASPRMPAVGFFGTRYGEKWHVDMVAFPHNAVRRQLDDAFLMANALGKMSLDVTETDLQRVYAWLGALEEFVDATLYAEDRFLYPLLDGIVKKKRVTLPDMLQPRARSDAKQQIRELLYSARKTRDVATGETTAKINALRYALDQFAANILDYYSEMEKFIPKVFKTHLRNGEKEKEKLEKRMLDQMLKEPHGHVMAALLMQCIESRSRRSEFLSRNIKKNSARDDFKIQVKKVQGTHMQLARTFDETATKYERRFSVTTFLQHYGANVNGDEDTLQMLGDVDLNDEDDVIIREGENMPENANAQFIYLEGNEPPAEAVPDDHVVKTLYDAPEPPPRLPVPE